MRGVHAKTLVWFVVALLLAAMPCVSACLAQACDAPSSTPPCHHKAPGKACPHQVLRAVNAPAPAQDGPIHPDAGPVQLRTDVKPLQSNILAIPGLGLSPPGVGSTHFSILRI